MPVRNPIIIAHRGASGYRPEHTHAAYALAIEMGADFIEPDLVMSKDGVLIVRHENELSRTTDVAVHPEFANRRTTKMIDGRTVSGWFTEDFTLAEVKTLRAVEPLADIRPRNAGFNGQFEILTLRETLDLAQLANERLRAVPQAYTNADHRCIGVYPETKFPSYFASIGLPMEAALVEALAEAGFGSTAAPVFIQSFETANLKELRRLTDMPLIQLINDRGAPYDFVVADDGRRYADLMSPHGLQEISAYADGIGVNKALIIPRDPDDKLLPPNSLVEDAHSVGLCVHAWTFRAENRFLPAEFRHGGMADGGDLIGELDAFLAAGIDGCFIDHPDLGVRARDAFLSHSRPHDCEPYPG
ncbi:MAG: glycerophosphodiester phosphodiesterase [Rhodospirillales bacterium]|nr:glycerophosphodiester phosphodiesterase [Rhodospirillales bacterium]